MWGIGLDFLLIGLYGLNLVFNYICFELEENIKLFDVIDLKVLFDEEKCKKVFYDW